MSEDAHTSRGAAQARSAPEPQVTDKFVSESFAPAEPQKVIAENHALIRVFQRSASFAKIISYVQGCSEAVISTKYSERITQNVADCCPTVRYLVEVFFPYLHQVVTDIPLEDMAQQRFGNRAKRLFHERLDAVVVDHMRQLVQTLPSAGAPYEKQPTPSQRSEEATSALAIELAAYMKDSFGNATRLDYGSGHELHFFIVLMICLEECGDLGGTLRPEPQVIVPLAQAPPPPVPEGSRGAIKKLRQEFIFFAFDAYMHFTRRIQRHYMLEPAGSHGVWGLDDYHHLPYVFGAAQLIGRDAATSPGDGGELILTKDVCDADKVKQLQGEYMYFAMIAWILENKKGPFFEHSNMLYNISGVPRWAKIYEGMVKMFAAEVLAKFNVSQHLLFGKHLPWNT